MVAFSDMACKVALNLRAIGTLDKFINLWDFLPQLLKVGTIENISWGCCEK